MLPSKFLVTEGCDPSQASTSATFQQLNPAALLRTGLQHVAAESMIAKGMAVSQAGCQAKNPKCHPKHTALSMQAGDLFISGRVVASPPLTGHSAIYKQAGLLLLVIALCGLVVSADKAKLGHRLM